MAKKTKVFQIKKGAPRKPATPKLPKAARVLDAFQQPEMGLIQGMRPGSADEFRVSVALDRLGYRYDYQVQTPGIKGAQGTYSIDFLVYTQPLPRPLEVKGTPWHTGVKGLDDEYREAMINQTYKGFYAPVVSIWTENTKTVEQAMSHLKMIL